ncbi:hypothetical protein Tsubulata_039181 [Turnera subulata]|uniref:Uncharacterized protein n=1 Tax=Turnera subulata TaxID=218843 RepID=A0A9Q0J257_9ROSI|nr:hypothetical protein Tsubulata_039181 [Turnera subulata]
MPPKEPKVPDRTGKEKDDKRDLGSRSREFKKRLLSQIHSLKKNIASIFQSGIAEDDGKEEEEKKDPLPVKIDLSLSLPKNLNGIDIDRLVNWKNKEVAQVFERWQKEFPGIELDTNLVFKYPISRDLYRSRDYINNLNNRERDNSHYKERGWKPTPYPTPLIYSAFPNNILRIVIEVYSTSEGREKDFDNFILWMDQHTDDLLDLFEEAFSSVKLEVELRFQSDILKIEDKE